MSEAKDAAGTQERASDFELKPIGDPEIYRAGGVRDPDLNDPTTFTTGQDMDMSLHRKLWIFQRIGWAAMAVIVVLALLGLSGGGGWLSMASAGGDGNLEVEYPQFERRYRPTTLKVSIPAGTAEDGQVTIWVDGDYLDSLEITSFTPEPSEQFVGSDGLGLVFQVADPAQPFDVSLSLEYERIGREHGEIWLDGQPRITFDQLIFP